MPKTGVEPPSGVKAILEALESVEKSAIEGAAGGGFGKMLPYLDAGLEEGKVSKFPELDHITAVAMPRVFRLARAALSDELEVVKSCSRSLIGLGVGLSPSADDLLAGFMSALWWICKSLGRGMELARNVNRAIVTDITGTTLVSQQVLRCTSVGETNEAVEGLLESVLRGQTQEAKGRVEEVLAIGETSGADTVVGVLLGFKVGLRLIGDPKTTALTPRKA
jgi:hypothetical protein